MFGSVRLEGYLSDLGHSWPILPGERIAVSGFGRAESLVEIDKNRAKLT